jgi:hypothetical protein
MDTGVDLRSGMMFRLREVRSRESLSYRLAEIQNALINPLKLTAAGFSCAGRLCPDKQRGRILRDRR